MKRKSLVIVGIIVALLVVIFVVLPLLINAERYRPTIETRLSDALGRPVHIGKLSFSLFAGAIDAEDISIADDPAFGPQPFLHAKRLEVGVELWPLIASRQVNITSLTLRAPELQLAQSAAGTWNFASLGGTRPARGAAAPNSGSAAPELRIQKLKIADGSIVVRRAGMTQRYTDLALQSTGFSRDTAFPFTLTAKTPGDGKLTIEGTAGPVPRADASQTPFEAKLKLDGLDLAHSGYFGVDSAIAGTANLRMSVRSDGRTLRADGDSTVEKLRLVKEGTPARHPVAFAFTSDYGLARQTGQMPRGDLNLGKGVVRLAGTFDTHTASALLHMTVNTQALPTSDIANLLPALGVALPGGASLQGGSTTASLIVEGPVDRLVINGPVHLQDVTLANFDLGQKVQTVAALAGIRTGRDTLIQSLDTRLRIAPEGMTFDEVKAVVSGMGALTGAGTLGTDHALNFKLVAHLSGRGGLLGGIVEAAGVGQLSQVPFRIEGTTDNPKFIPDVGAIIQTQKQPSQTQQQKKPLGGILGGILGKKK